MVAKTGGASHGASHRGRRRTVVRVVTILGVAIAVWLVVGLLRAETVARNYFARVHEGQTLADVVTGGLPAIPPFWAVKIDGDVIQPGETNAVYRSHMILLVEPITGWVVVFGAG